jgi:hypothetical protein
VEEDWRLRMATDRNGELVHALKKIALEYHEKICKGFISARECQSIRCRRTWAVIEGNGPVAQTGERLPRTQEAAGSIPAGSTIGQ